MASLTTGGITLADPPGHRGDGDTRAALPLVIAQRSATAVMVPLVGDHAAIDGTRTFGGGVPGLARAATGVTVDTTLVAMIKPIGSVTRQLASPMLFNRSATGTTTVTLPSVTSVAPPPTLVDAGGSAQRRRTSPWGAMAVFFKEVGGQGARVRLSTSGAQQALDAAGTSAPRQRVATAGAGKYDLAVAGGAAGRGRAATASPDLLNLIDMGGTAARTRSAVAGSDYAIAIPLGGTGTRARIVRAGVEKRTPPANDAVENAVTLTGSTGSVNYSTVAATLQPEEPDLVSTVVGPAGSVWFSWDPAVEGVASFGTSSGVELEAFVGPDTIPRSVLQPWSASDLTQIPVKGSLDWVFLPSSGTGWYSASYVKLYQATTKLDLHAGDSWTSMHSTADNIARSAGETAGTFVEMDLFTGPDPGNVDENWVPSAPDTYVTWIGVASDDVSPRINTLGYTIPAGTTILLIAVQWPDAYNADGTVSITPATGWEPTTDSGSWALTLPPAPAHPFANLVPVGGGNGSMTLETRASEKYYLRAYSLNGSTPSDSATLTWSLTELSLNFRLIDETMEGAPGTVSGSIWDETPDTTVSFYLDDQPDPFQVETLDENGDLTNFTLVVAEIASGGHAITATADDRSATASFTVLIGVADPPDDSAGVGTDPNNPAFVSPPVDKWQLYDPTNGSSWSFPINPESVDSPVLPRTLTPHSTTSPLGQPITFEGARRAKTWALQGHLFTLDDADDLTSWTRKPWRVYLTDDFGRTFLVMVQQVQTVPVKDIDRPEHVTYTLTMQLFGRINPGGTS